MRIALVVHCFFPAHFYGTETYTLELARNLRDLGHDPLVISAVFPGEPADPEIFSYYEYENIPVYCINKNRFPNTRVKDTYYQPELKDFYRDLFSRLQPDIVHVTHLINHTAVVLEVLAELNLPVVTTMTDFFGFCFNNKLEAANGSLCTGPSASRTNCLACLLKARAQNPGITWVDRAAGTWPLSYMTGLGLNLLRRSPGLRAGRIAGFVLDVTLRPDILTRYYNTYRAAIAPTDFLRDAYIMNGLQTPIHKIHFGVDIARAPKPMQNANVPLRFGFIGQIAPHKGVDILIDAFCRLQKEGTSLDIFGPEDQDPAYMNTLRAMTQGHDIHFRGTFPKEQMAEIFAGLDFLVIPSRWYENSPLVLLNSLATHTPVIIANVKGMTEFIELGKNGYIFRRGSAESLAKVLRSIVDDPQKARAMSSTTTYEKTTRTMTKEVIELYHVVKAERTVTV